MSSHDVTRLLLAAEDDPALKNELEGAADVDRLVENAAGHGYDFTAQELQTVLAQLRGAAPEELGEDQLEKVAGGVQAVANGSRAVAGDKYQSPTQSITRRLERTSSSGGDLLGFDKVLPGVK